ncbi:hypothetical protein NDU88_002672 [Pleurodeles waltl]|uniref:Uncharacterized protein n=1 Tax=Pleurodeles waltl TaxID=8319 RepID=A0AAV7P9R5_PLEWA|nr:hypothetical protein NDU88_002672 [Pleurodeles waltl]
MNFQCMDDEQPGPFWALSSVCSGHTVMDYDEVEEDSLEEGEVREEEASQLMDEMAWWYREDGEGSGHLMRFVMYFRNKACPTGRRSWGCAQGLVIGNAA